MSARGYMTRSFQVSAEHSLVLDLANLKPQRKKAVFALLAMDNILICMCLSILQPVLPIEIKETFPSHFHGAVVGAIFSVATVSDFLFTPVVAREIAVVGPRRLLLLGILLVAGVTILFAFVSRVYEWSTFLGLCFSLRIAQGFGTAMVSTSSFALLAGMYPDQIAMMNGMLELFTGLGFLVGPGMGGVLYEYGGFKAPFLTAGIILMAGVLIIWWLLPQTAYGPGQSEGKLSFWTLLSNPRIALLLVGNVVCVTTVTFFDPTLGPYLHHKFNFSPAKVGGAFLLVSGTYAIFSPVVGYIVDELSTSPVFIPFGAFVVALGCELMGPHFLFGANPTVAFVLAGLTVIGFGATFLLIPTAADILITMKENGHGDSLVLHGAIGAALQASFSLGLTLGPLIGGLLTEEYNFNDPLSGMGFVMIVYGIALIIQTIHPLSLVRKLRAWRETVDGELTERTRLIQDED